MCRYACFLIFILSVSTAFAQQKVRDNTVQNGVILPSTDALLELESTNKGLLHVRVALVQTTEAAPLTKHVAGMMVYNTATANDVIPGIYYNNGSRWVLAAAGQASAISYDSVRHQLTYVDAEGASQVIDLKQVVKQNETVTTLRDNGDGTVTFTNELGESVVVNLAGGANGKSAYELALANGFVGTLTEWLASLQGAEGAVGRSAYDSWLTLPGNEIKTLAEFIASLKGAQGERGETGAQGETGERGASGIQGEQGNKGDQGERGAAGADGAAGQSAYEVALANGFAGTLTEWLASLQGVAGSAGRSAYDSWLTLPGNESKTLAEFIASLKGAQGERGETGARGEIGERGASGPQGETGDKGEQGERGEAGVDGIGGRTTAGANVRVTGSGTADDPYVVDAADPQLLADFQITGGTLAISIANGNTVSIPLAALAAAVNTDNQEITVFEIDASTHVLTLTLAGSNTQTVDLSPYFQTAGDVAYDGTGSGLAGSSVQQAIDELAGKETTVIGSDHVIVTKGGTGSKTEYTVAVSVANGTNAGVVKQAAENPTVMINHAGELSVNMGNFNPIREVVANYTATLNDAILLGNATGGPLTITLPTPNDTNKGKKYTIKKQDSNEDTYVNVTGAIEGDITLYTALPYSGWDLVSDGTTWKIVNKF